MRPLRRALLAPFALALALAACATPGAPIAQQPSPSSAGTATAAAAEPPTATTAASPAVTATDAPTTAPTAAATDEPTNEPTAAAPTSAPSGGLPRAAYFISAETNQVTRIEADGATTRQITFEELPVRWLAVAPNSGTIVYVAADDAGVGALYALDGGGRRRLMAGTISQPALSPDGQTVAYRLENPEPGLIVGQDESPTGVWVSSTGGMRPSLVRADAPDDDEFDPDNPAWVYWPIDYSPDGRLLALYAFDGDGPGIPGGQVVFLERAGSGERTTGFTCCEEERWSLDSRSLLVAGGGPGPDVRYGLFRLDAATGAEEDLLPGLPDDTVALVTAPQQLADGAVYAFVELLPWADLSWEHPFRPALSRVEADGAVTPLRPATEGPLEVLWDPQAAGALVTTFADEARGDAEGQLIWLPAGPGEPLRLPALGSLPRWASNVPLSAGECGAFSDIRFEPAGTRSARPEARDVQLRLAALGFDPGPADGLYGAGTQAAVRAFQDARGLSASGDVDCATWRALIASEGP